MERDKGGKAHDALKVGAGAAAEAAAGLVALVTQTKVGPAGAVAIGAATAETLRHLAERAITFRDYQAGRTVEIAADEAHLALDELERRLFSDPNRLQLAAATLTAAANTALEAKIRTLGRALATGALATDDAQVDEQRFLVDTLADLEAPHIRVLHQLSIRHEGYGEARTADGRYQAHGWSIDDLAVRLPGIAAVLRPVLNVLAGHALILDTGVGTLGYVAGQSGRWVLTDYGQRCLALLKERGREDPN
jgi:hypothetical protein